MSNCCVRSESASVDGIQHGLPSTCSVFGWENGLVEARKPVGGLPKIIVVWQICSSTWSEPVIFFRSISISISRTDWS